MILIRSLLILFLLFSLVVLTLNGCATRPTNLGLREGRLAPCPDSPNCVSSFESDKTHGIEPLPADWEQLKTVLAKVPRTTVITETDNYMHVEFRVRILRFVDDVEFWFDPVNQCIQVRSASRVGHSDLGVNRRRIEHIRKQMTGARL